VREEAYSALVGKREGKKSLGRPTRRCVDNIEMINPKVGCGVMYWIELVQDGDRRRARVNAVMNLQIP
jgi:hypothetical protein